MLSILFFNELDSKSVQKNFNKVLQQLSNGDFKSADVKKMTNTGYYRARLSLKDRLLFTFASYNQQKYLLLLEVIEHHDYAKSRFLRGAVLPDESALQPLTKLEDINPSEIKPLNYVNAKAYGIHLLNKFISFDDTQQEILHLHPPLIIIGSAGSGKTVLVLEKLKQLKGNVAYISLSNYLVENARKLYFSNGYENENSEVDFLSFQQYLESWQIPEGMEINFRLFEQWFSRHAQYLKIKEPYRVYEEFKGVLTGSPLHTAFLSRDEYFNLGIKQSIFSSDKREEVYGLFIKYLQWMKENTLYDTNMLSFEYLRQIKPRYDYVMIDEVQDITAIQLKCIMQSLGNQSHFLLTGDSNQIVHPNFFSWSKIKTYLYQHKTDNKQLQILQTNYRNSPEVVRLSNTLLKIKNQRFGSIDKESNYLINTISAEKGEVLLMEDNEKVKAELNRKTQNSTRYAVIVANNNLKETAKKYFKTPLIFSVQEAKGLEYENVILLNFISTNPLEFKEIINGVDAADLEEETLQYARPADKADKDGEIYKFFINSFYVAITRSVKNIYLFESQVNHPALGLLSLKEITKPLQVAEQKSDRQEWLEEARRLEEQGKYEQAEQIRAKYLGYEYISAEELEKIKLLALDATKKEAEVKKERKQLFQYALNHHQVGWINELAKLQFQRAMLYMRELRQDGKEFEKNCRLGRRDEVKRVVVKYGANFTAPDSELNGLALSLYYGHENVADMLLQEGATVNNPNAKGMLPFDYLLQGYFKTSIYRQPLLTPKKTVLKYWNNIRPSSITIKEANRKLSVGSHSMPYLLLVMMRCIHLEMALKIKVSFKDGSMPDRSIGVFTMNDLVAFAECLPDEVIQVYRKQRTYINQILASHEVDKDSPYNKKLFKRLERGKYIINPTLEFEV